MWVRQWRGEASKADSDICLNYLLTIAVPQHKLANGNLSAHVLRMCGEIADEFRLFSYRHSLEAIQAFARDEEPTLIQDQTERDYLASIGLDVLIYQPFDLDNYSSLSQEV
jgi:hypothetical protein